MRCIVLLGLMLSFVRWVDGQSVASTAQAQATGAVPTGTISVRFKNVPLQEAVQTIVQRSGIDIAYSPQSLPAGVRVTYQGSGVSPVSALESIVRNTGVRVLRGDGGRLKLVYDGVRRAQGVVSGKVVDAKTGRGISGANISVGNDARSTVSGEDGFYKLTGLPEGAYTVTVRLVGYAKQSRSVTVGEGTTVRADFMLDPSVSVLDQVVVTGTVAPTELKAVPNAITVITAKQIEERGITKIDQLFRGDVPGLFAQNQGSRALLDEVTMFSRGATALSGSSAGVSNDPNVGVSFLTNPIKTYVDGVELADPSYLSQIDPKSIERIEILAGPQASTIYGSNAINGVMQIFTKRGTTSRPQLTLNLLSGWVENDFNDTRTPQHDLGAQLNGVEGRLSYNAGGSWNYMGPWTPAKQLTRTSAFGGTRLDLVTSGGLVTTDVAIRRVVTQAKQRGSQFQTGTGYRETGWYLNFSNTGLSGPITHLLTGQTLGLTLVYSPADWWSHELNVGNDVSDKEVSYTRRGYSFRSDTTLALQQNHSDRRSVHYATTVRLPVTSLARAAVTAGMDSWQKLTSSWTVRPQTLTGPLTGSTSISRRPDHNTGAFVQMQMGVQDRVFVTYGLRAEWNPSFGETAEPNYAPRYGVAYTQDVGVVTAKVRASYGRSTRPPQPDLKVARRFSDAVGSAWNSYSPYYEDFDFYLANPVLAPEHQQGGEGGIELYWGSLGSLVVTRYNQTVDGLIATTKVDSTMSFVPTTSANSISPDGYGYIWQYQYLNVASIRNQGWELQGAINFGPITTRGTYSWTKSRAIGTNPKYRSWFTPGGYPQYQPGATFRYLPEHTWALGMIYARGGSTVAINVTGTGRVTILQDDFYHLSLNSEIRLPQNRFSMTSEHYVNFNSGYALIDVNASHRFTPHVEGVLQVQNLADRYTNDYRADYATIGRQLKGGLRIRLP